MLNSKFDLYKGEWLDLVFKNRNHEYGAYELRRSYDGILVKAMVGVLVFIAIMAVAITVTADNKPKDVSIDKIIPVTITPTDKIYEVKKEEIHRKVKQPAKVDPPPATLKVSTVNLNMKPVEDNLVKEEVKTPDPQAASGPVDLVVAGSKPGDNPGTGDKGTEGVGAAPATVDNGEYTTADNLQVLPEPIGGDAAWSKFLQKNLRYPGMAQDQGVSGRVYMTFIIEKDGSLSDITVMRKAGFGFDEESLRVLKLAKKWRPGIQNGQPVRVRYTLPINFQITEP